MKNLIFKNYFLTMRKDIVRFSQSYNSMINDIKAALLGRTTIKLSLGRISDTGVNISPVTSFFNVVKNSLTTITASYYGEQYNESGDDKIPITKTIRFDNPFGEIPILPGYEKTQVFLIGEDLESYQAFINQTRETLVDEVGKDIQLCYKNDDGSFSVIEGTLKEVNKGNIFLEDYCEILVVDNKSTRVELLVSREKNHRFISERGFLFSVSSAFFNKENMMDDTQIFGYEPTWNFLIEKIKKVA